VSLRSLQTGYAAPAASGFACLAASAGHHAEDPDQIAPFADHGVCF
jgi:hypothetical protein